MPLAPIPSPAAKQTIKAAFESLGKTIRPADSQHFAETTLQDVRAFAIQLEEKLAARKALRNMRRLDPLLKGLQHYSKVVDILCNGTPYLAWIWAPITLILKIASEYVEAFEKIINAYSRIAESLQRFEFLDKAFASDNDFQQTLAAFYADILDFHQHAYKFITRNGWKLLFLTSWGRFQRRFNSKLESMKRHERLIDKEANARNIAEAREMRHEIRQWRQENLEQIERLEKEETEKQYHSISSWLKVNDSEQQEIYNTLRSEGQNHPGTCNWALKNKHVQLFFQRKPVTQALWLHGVPGSGKSVLSAELANFAEAADWNIIRFFCSRSYRSNTYERILGSLFLQLLRKDSELIANVYRESVLGKLPPSGAALEKLFHKILMSSSSSAGQDDYIFVFIDGLNECDVETQTKVVNLANLMTSNVTRSSGMISKMFISSRASEIISRHLRRKGKLALTDEKAFLSEAIQIYTAQRLQALHVKLEQLNLTGRDIGDIEQSITRKSDGMFLYARLILDYLANNIFIRGTQIISAVNGLPKELSDFYSQILSQILAHLNPQSVKHVETMFRWVAFARRPLTRVEFLSAMAFSEGDFTITNSAPRFILEACNPLVEERSDGTLSFIHTSVQEFLESAASSLRITEKDAVEEQGTATVTCLLSGLQTLTKPHDDRSRNVQVAKGLHALHIYATEYWTEYLFRYVELLGSCCSTSQLIDLANNLSQCLESLTVYTLEEKAKAKASPPDSRLELLRDYPAIQKHVKIAISARSMRHLETQTSQLVQNTTVVDHNQEPTEQGLEAILSSYQKTILFLLSQEEYPGVSPQELEEFKRHFRTSAYTCRFGSCPRATLGFESKEEWLQHELAHLRRWVCTVVGCQYPPFDSTRALRAHNKAHHENVAGQRPIRRFRILPERNSNSPQSVHEALALTSSTSSQAHKTSSLAADVPIPLPSSLSYTIDSGGFIWSSSPLGDEGSSTYGEVAAPYHEPFQAQPVMETPPSWLVIALNSLREVEAYQEDQFEATWEYSVISKTTGQIISYSLVSMHESRLSVRPCFIPRVRCLNCDGELYEPGDAWASKFKIHLNSIDHRARVDGWKFAYGGRFS
ncbi:hypothetical protein F4859DRAFT_486121 [Xylaria cf. heliscus]|nr:hypothetical protein F4859DRAFT_486121 [Xylaria cf. heliscus]